MSGGTICRRGKKEEGRRRKEELEGSQGQSIKVRADKVFKYAETGIDGVDRPNLIFTDQ